MAHGIPTYRNLTQREPKPSPYVGLGFFCYTKGDVMYRTQGKMAVWRCWRRVCPALDEA